MSACAATPCADTLWVDVQTCGIRAQVADCAFHVLYHRREFVTWCQAIIYCCDEESLRGEVGEGYQATLGLVTLAPPAAVNKNRHGCRIGGLRRKIQIQLQFHAIHSA